MPCRARERSPPSSPALVIAWISPLAGWISLPIAFHSAEQKVPHNMVCASVEHSFAAAPEVNPYQVYRHHHPFGMRVAHEPAPNISPCRGPFPGNHADSLRRRPPQPSRATAPSAGEKRGTERRVPIPEKPAEVWAAPSDGSPCHDPRSRSKRKQNPPYRTGDFSVVPIKGLEPLRFPARF